MQTQFTPALLADPDNAESRRILRTCVHCGFCLATCPTYLLTGNELDGPRGRIYLSKNMLEQGRPADAATVKHLDRCLSCLGCMTTCPSGVHYMHLIDHARRHIEQTYRRPWGERLLRGTLAKVLPHTERFRLALRAARLLHPLRALLPARLRTLVDLAAAAPPQSGAGEGDVAGPGVAGAPAGKFKRVALLSGCVQPVLRAQINQAASRILRRHGVEVVVARDAGCCGALVHHLGQEHPALAQARANIDAWTREIEGQGLDAIVVTASGCGTMLKDYGFLFRNDALYAAKAARIAQLAVDVSEALAQLPLASRRDLSGLRVAYHSACSLQHGQRLHQLPQELLRNAGFAVLEIPEGHVCCGSAGTYQILQPQLSRQLLERKAGHIATLEADVVAAGNIGCITQLAAGVRLPIVHTAELLDWAEGGPRPADLPARLAR